MNYDGRRNAYLWGFGKNRRRGGTKESKKDLPSIAGETSFDAGESLPKNPLLG